MAIVLPVGRRSAMPRRAFHERLGLADDVVDPRHLVLDARCESPRETGLQPARPKSMLPATIASLTEPPESKSFHSISVSGKASSSQPSCFTTRSPLGMAW